MDKIKLKKIHEPALTGSFLIKNLSDLLLESAMVEHSHRHDYFFILALAKGSGKHIIDFIPYPVHEYALYFIAPGQVHQLELEQGTTGFLLSFDPLFYNPKDILPKQVNYSFLNRNYFPCSKASYLEINKQLHFIQQEANSMMPHFKESIRSALNIFFIAVYRALPKDHRTTSPAKAYAIHEAFKALLENNVNKQRDVPYYADQLHISSYQLNSAMKEVHGKTAAQVITDSILLEAKRKLGATTTQIKQIAFSLGFADPSYFIRFFKKHTGKTPEDFRNSLP